MKRQAVTIVIDGVDVGALPDAARYGDEGANSLGSAARGLEGFDAWLGRFIGLLAPGTLFAVTSDHGCDPTMRGSDHTREYVPVPAGIAGASRENPLGTRETFGDLAATLVEFFELERGAGDSFLDSLER